MYKGSHGPVAEGRNQPRHMNTIANWDTEAPDPLMSRDMSAKVAPPPVDRDGVGRDLSRDNPDPLHIPGPWSGGAPHPPKYLHGVHIVKRVEQERSGAFTARTPWTPIFTTPAPRTDTAPGSDHGLRDPNVRLNAAPSSMEPTQ